MLMSDPCKLFAKGPLYNGLLYIWIGLEKKNYSAYFLKGYYSSSKTNLKGKRAYWQNPVTDNQFCECTNNTSLLSNHIWNKENHIDSSQSDMK